MPIFKVGGEYTQYFKTTIEAIDYKQAIQLVKEMSPSEICNEAHGEELIVTAILKEEE